MNKKSRRGFKSSSVKNKSKFWLNIRNKMRRNGASSRRLMDFENFRTVPFYTDCGTGKNSHVFPVSGLGDSEKFRTPIEAVGLGKVVSLLPI